MKVRMGYGSAATPLQALVCGRPNQGTSYVILGYPHESHETPYNVITSTPLQLSFQSIQVQLHIPTAALNT